MLKILFEIASIVLVLGVLGHSQTLVEKLVKQQVKEVEEAKKNKKYEAGKRAIALRQWSVVTHFSPVVRAIRQALSQGWLRLRNDKCFELFLNNTTHADAERTCMEHVSSLASLASEAESL